jgi:hypothetical protein
LVHHRHGAFHKTTRSIHSSGAERIFTGDVKRCTTTNLAGALELLKKITHPIGSDLSRKDKECR